MHNRFVVVELDEFAKGLELDLKPGAVFIVEVTKLDE